MSGRGKYVADFATPLWRAWSPYTVSDGVFESRAPAPWRAYRQALQTLDPSRRYRSNNTRLARLIGFSDRVDYNQCSGLGWLLLMGFCDPCPIKDIRGRTLSFLIRGLDWRSNGSKFVFWFQGGRNLPNSKGTANYALTARALTNDVESGEWRDVSLVAQPDEAAWTYAGWNDHQVDRERYGWIPIADAMRDVDNVHFVVVMPTPTDHFPSGRFQLTRFEIG